MLTPCISQADLSLNPAAHLAGVRPAGGKAAGGGNAVDSPAFRLRLRRLLGVCLDYVEAELNKVRAEQGSGEMVAQKTKKLKRKRNKKTQAPPTRMWPAQRGDEVLCSSRGRSLITCFPRCFFNKKKKQYC